MAKRAKLSDGKKTIWQYIEPSLKYIFLTGGLIYVFYHIHYGELLHQLIHIHWTWVPLAIGVDVLSYICQGLRWKWLLPPVAEMSTLQATEAIYAGRFANEVLPIRLGELFKAFLVSRWISADFPSVIPSVVAARVLDGIWSVAGLGVIALFVHLPQDFVIGGAALAFIIIIGSAAFLFSIYYEHQVLSDWAAKKAEGGKLLRLIKWLIGLLTIGFQKIGFSRLFFQALAISPIFLGLQAFAFWLVLKTYGIHLSFLIGAAVFLIIHFGVLLPNSPGNLGVYQFFCVVGLTIFGIDKTHATGFSMVVYALLRVPLWIIGFLVISRSVVDVNSVKEEIDKLKKV